jgi:hypothetical protein
MALGLAAGDFAIASDNQCVEALVSVLVTFPLLAAPVPAGVKSRPTEEAESAMSIVFGEDAFDRLPQTLRMRQDLSDPARRIGVREEYRQGLPGYYPDIREELHLTAEREAQLFDLLADFQMLHLDLFYARPSGAPLETASRFGDNDRRRDETLLAFLGQETYDKYRVYQQDLPDRQGVAYFAARLDPADALSTEQRTQLRAVLKAEREEAQSKRAERRLRAPGKIVARTEAELLEANIRLNEDSLRELEAASHRLLQRAASSITTRQLAALSQIERENIDGQRRCIQNLRMSSRSEKSLVPGQRVFISAQAESEPVGPKL